MNDVDERYPSFKERKPDDIIFREKCHVCGAWITLSRSDEVKLLAELDPNLPAQRVVVTCTNCHKYQVVFGARYVK